MQFGGFFFSHFFTRSIAVLEYCEPTLLWDPKLPGGILATFSRVGSFIFDANYIIELLLIMN